jgi:hypothetical protein
MPSTAIIQRSFVYRIRAKMGGYHPIVRWYRQHRPVWWWLRTHAAGRVTARYVRDNGLTVKRGPFAGLTYSQAAVGHVGFIPAKLCGSYEPTVIAKLTELAPQHDLFVDIGSAEGFYLNGMARAFPKLQIIGFETTPGERELALEMARINGVQIDQRGTADPVTLQDLPAGRILALVDIEGYEQVLLDPDRIPRLREMSMVVELHDLEAPGIEGTLRQRFGATHDIEMIYPATIDVESYPELRSWSHTDKVLATHDRPVDVGVWMVLTPK